MHLCYIADVNSVHLHRWVSFFVERGHQVSVITDADGVLPGVTVYNTGDCMPSIRLPGLSATYQILEKAYRIRKVIRQIKPDLVHGHYATNCGFLAALSGFTPLVQTVHGSDVLVDAVGSREKRWFVRHALQKATWITSPAKHMTERLLDMGIPGDRITTIQYGVDTGVFKPPENPAERRSFRVVSTRMFEWRYNVDLLIRAIPALRDRVPEVEIVLAGDGPDRVALQDLAQKLNVTDAIRMVGLVAHASMPELLQSAAVYVSTSVTDGSSLSLLEAMACGAFPVVTDIPANREWIADGENGFLVTTADPDALADRIARTLTDPVMQAEICARNAALVRARGDYHTNMQRIESIYEQLCESHTFATKT